MIDFNTKLALEHFNVSTNDLLGVIATAMGKGADYADLFFEHTNRNQLVLQDGEVNRTASSIDYGVGIRAIAGDQTGVCLCRKHEPARHASSRQNSCQHCRPEGNNKPCMCKRTAI